MVTQTNPPGHAYRANVRKGSSVMPATSGELKLVIRGRFGSETGMIHRVVLALNHIPMKRILHKRARVRGAEELLKISFVVGEEEFVGAGICVERELAQAFMFTGKTRGGHSPDGRLAPVAFPAAPPTPAIAEP